MCLWHPCLGCPFSKFYKKVLNENESLSLILMRGLVRQEQTFYFTPETTYYQCLAVIISWFIGPVPSTFSVSEILTRMFICKENN